jgi:hypothetical protein
MICRIPCKALKNQPLAISWRHGREPVKRR